MFLRRHLFNHALIGQTVLAVQQQRGAPIYPAFARHRGTFVFTMDQLICASLSHIQYGLKWAHVESTEGDGVMRAQMNTD